MRDGRSAAHSQCSCAAFFSRRLLQTGAHFIRGARVVQQVLAFDYADRHSLNIIMNIITGCCVQQNHYPYSSASDGTRSPVVRNPRSTRMSCALLDSGRNRFQAIARIYLLTSDHVVTNDTPHPISAVARRRALRQ